MRLADVWSALRLIDGDVPVPYTGEFCRFASFIDLACQLDPTMQLARPAVSGSPGSPKVHTNNASRQIEGLTLIHGL